MRAAQGLGWAQFHPWALCTWVPSLRLLPPLTLWPDVLLGSNKPLAFGHGLFHDSVLLRARGALGSGDSTSPFSSPVRPEGSDEADQAWVTLWE